MHAVLVHTVVCAPTALTLLLIPIDLVFCFLTAINCLASEVASCLFPCFPAFLISIS
jgi:hypothetical protein